jgi:hypothetical protein
MARPKGSKNKRPTPASYHSVFDAKPDFDAPRRMRQAREFERKALRVSSFRPAPPPPAPAPVEGPHTYVYVIIANGNGAADPGTIQEGYYTIAGNVVRVRDAEERLLGTQALRPGENAVTVAKQILRKGAPNEFWRPLPARVYPGV